ncbi:hypothetical protein ILYODFUR_007149 [Ilyodon furcidens]|uniref:Triokinase/FMN cyclase n=1 Tax=Ilyodon furcidens TaxID=33524 RepID=A0ABV0TI09_9TELE
MEPQKKLINSVDRCVDEALCGLVRASGGLCLLKGHRVVLRSDLDSLKGKVALLSGGGSGHEPAHGGYIGAGMLSAAVAGGVFASPPPASILAAILSLHQAGASGILLIVKNYTGDRLNFGPAAEQARNQGVNVDMLIVAEDCAFDQPSKAGRRGLCGTVFIHKLAGALAEEGCSLDQIVSKMKEVLKRIGTLGVSLSPCSVPGCLPSFDLPPGAMELGLGIHGEPGIKRSKVASADEVVKTMIDHMTNPDSQSHLPLKSGDSFVLCVNNLGALSCLEMAVVTRAAITCLESRGVVVARVMSGSFMTSLEMAGVSLTLMRANPETLRLFDAKTSAPAWPNLSTACVSGRSYITEAPAMSMRPQDDKHSQGPLSPVMRKVLDRICSTLLEKQEELNSLDRAAGDGDCGNTHAQAARAFQEWLQDHVIPGCPGQLLSVLAGLVEEKMGGSSGALYSLFLTAAAGHVTEGRSSGAAWATAVHAGTQAMRRYGGADPGDRTMLDALCPAAEELMKLTTAPPAGQMDVLHAAVQKAAAGAEATRDLTARAGRASYIAAERVTLPDPGAVAVAAILKAVAETLGEQKVVLLEGEPPPSLKSPAASNSFTNSACCTQTTTKMEFACSHVVCNWGPDGPGISQFGPNYENIAILKQQTDALPPPLPPRRFRKPRPTSLPNPPFSPSHLPVTPLSLPPPVPPRRDLLEGENRFKVNINVVSLGVGKLADISQDTGLESFQSPVICGKCSAALSCLSSVWKKLWVCEFCGYENGVDENLAQVCIGQRAGVRSDDLYLPRESEDDYQNLEDTMVVFCVDISGSMTVTTEVTSDSGSTAHVSRLEGIQDALQRTLTFALQKTPHRRVALVTFNDEVVIYGDGTRTPLTIKDWALVDYEHIWKQAVGYNVPHCIAETHQDLSRRVKELREHGATALGPAALASVALASKYPGSKVILCTDGRANIGLGDMEQAQSSSAKTPYFYRELALHAVAKGVIISVMSFRGTDCRLADIGRLADMTGGRVYKACVEKPDWCDLNLLEHLWDE